MRLLALTDYTLRILMLLGREPLEETTTVESLAQRLGGLSRNHLHKIVQELAGLGIVQTVRGTGAGVRLAKPTRHVKIGALVHALEADHALVECFRADYGCCTLDPGCHLRPMLKDARESFCTTLDTYSLADCLRQPASRGRQT
jgi:Rrf2 family nitric oxide-sensitive transcriptional repressor